MNKSYLRISLFVVMSFFCIQTAQAADVKLISDMSRFNNGFRRVFTDRAVNNFVIELSEKSSENGLGDSYVYYRNNIIGPVQANDYKFSDDGQVVVILDPYKGVVYKNNLKLSLYNSGSGIIFEPKTKQVAYLSGVKGKYNLVIDDKIKTAVSLSGRNPTVSSFDRIFKFSPDGKKYAIVSSYTNPSYEAKAQALFDKYMPLYDKLSQDRDAINADDPVAVKAFSDAVDALEAKKLKDQETLEKSFAKDWIYKDQLISDGKIVKETTIIHDFAFTSKGDLTYIYSEGGKAYLFFGGKNIDLGAYNQNVRLYGLKVSKDGKRYALIINTSNKDSSTYQVFIDGKKSEVYKSISWKSIYGETNPVLFSPDSKHYAYPASLNDKDWFTVYDGKKSESFQAGSFGGVSLETWMKFSTDNVLYFVAVKNKTNCLYINNKKAKCVNGVIDPDYSTWEYLKFSADGKSYAYLNAVKEKENSVTYLVLNQKTFGPYKKGVHNFSMSPDGKKIAYIHEDSLYLNGKLISNKVWSRGSTTNYWFTPNSKLLYLYPGSSDYNSYSVKNEDNKVITTYQSNGAEINESHIAKNGTVMWQFYVKDKTLYWKTIKID